MDKLIAKKYAKALMESGDEAAVSTRLELLKAVAEAFKEPAVRDLLTSPLVDKAEKSRLIVEALGGDVDPVVTRLVELMAQKNRLALIPEMVEMIAFERKKASNRFEGIVYSDTSLSEESIKKLEASLERYSGARITLGQQQSDQPGLKVEVEDLGIELSFSREKVKQALIDHIQKAL
jgi:F-type H+-transporting ATPase subunit delta